MSGKENCKKGHEVKSLNGMRTCLEVRVFEKNLKTTSDSGSQHCGLGCFSISDKILSISNVLSEDKTDNFECS
jgi:hypothetical protein